jgi:hypothetical protein
VVSRVQYSNYSEKEIEEEQYYFLFPKCQLGPNGSLACLGDFREAFLPFTASTRVEGERLRTTGVRQWPGEVSDDMVDSRVRKRGVNYLWHPR